ncbi:MAG TPA: sulfite exporter TauE/SafE family protein [Terriglobales bacterium]|nr:sulfite exporter TauE/SafE family protein [Terriglobales bacterium]
MELIAFKIVVGFVVGTLIGMTGVGGGVLLLPVLIFGLNVPPIVAVGSDALFNFVTKIGSGWMHLRKGTVRKKVVLALAVGSLPGSIVGVSVLAHLRGVYGAGVNDFIRYAVGALLIAVPALLFFQGRIEERVAHRPPTMSSFLGISAIGLLAGVLVGMTSVGSGSIIMMLLLLLYSFSPKVMVGTDIVHAVALTGLTALLHFRLGNVDFRLVSALLIGSIPGGILGSHLSTRVPVPWLRRILYALLLATGARMLWA